MDRPLLRSLPAFVLLTMSLVLFEPQTGAAISNNTKIILHGVSFNADTGTVAPSAAPVLDEAAKLLRNDPSALVALAPDARDAANECSETRPGLRNAESVRDYLMRSGIAEPHVEDPQVSPAVSVVSND
jgi:outer membrane protein OmpA-like peptidoglycan-associated protein